MVVDFSALGWCNVLHLLDYIGLTFNTILTALLKVGKSSPVVRCNFRSKIDRHVIVHAMKLL